MRNIYFSLFCFIPLFVFGQSQNLETTIIDSDVNSQIVKPHDNSDVSVVYSSGFQDYTFTDLQGGTYNIHNELNQGKTVVLTFMNYFTSMCQNEVKYLNHIKDVYETEEDMIRIWGIEMSEFSTLSSAGIDLNTLYDEWGLSYPLMNINGLDSYLSGMVTSVPTYIVIAPDHSYTIISSINYEEDILSYLNQHILNAGNVSTDYDVDLYNVEHDYCNGNLNLYLSIQNTGIVTHNGFNVVLTTDSGDIIDEFYFTTPLSPKARVELSFLYGANQITETTFNVELMSVYSTENTRNDKAYVELDESLNTTSNSVQLRLQTDNYPQEIAWQLRDNTAGAYVDSAGLGSGGNIIGLAQGLHTYNFNLVENHCYTLHLYDSFGDGICCTNGNGYYKIIDSATGTVLQEGGNYQLSDKVHFRILPEVIGIEEHMVNNDTPLDIIRVDYYDLLGRNYSEPKKNTIMLKRTVFSDYSVKSEKIHLK